jgi:hypothetical protein
VVAAVTAAAAAGAGLQTAVRGAAFQRLAFANYVESPRLASALAGIRDQRGPTDRLAFLGHRDAVSPALLRWHLGPPSGEATFPLEILRVADLAALETSELVLLVAPLDPRTTTMSIANDHARDLARVRTHVRAGALAIVHEYPIPDLEVSLRLYRRAVRGI